MSEVVDHLAELTGFRDRDVLDVTLVGAFRELLRPASVAIYRPVGDADRRHWLTRARLLAHESTPRAESIWADLDDLPALACWPDHQHCLQQQTLQTVASADQVMTLIPLITDRDASGVLELRTEEPLSTEQHRLIHSVLRVYHNFQELLDYSERDTLTGLLNRKTFDGSFLRVVSVKADPDCASPVDRDGMERRRAAPTTAWMGVVDIDHFKRVNDTHGHLIGDEVLLLVARLMRSSFRFRDLIYRFGGEEFVVLMRGGSAAQACSALERLRVNVESYVFPQVGQITVSVGFTELRKADSPAAAFERADKAVYYAKQNGRNRVVSHGELVSRGVFAEEARAGDMELF